MAENDETIYLGGNGSAAPVDEVINDRTSLTPDAGVNIPNNNSPVPVVGLGGSAGSLETLQRFFAKLPPDSGMAYLVVVHLSPELDGALATTLQRTSNVPIIQVSEPVKMQPNHAYVIPSGKHLSMSDGVVQALEMTRPKGRHVTVDTFFRTLAEAHGSEATAIVLSGGDGDGALGLKRIKERGGLTIAQDPAEADFEGMPRAAIATGMVDWILPIEEIPAKLVGYRETGRRIQLPSLVAPGAFEPRDEEKDEATLREILLFLRTRTSHDFSSYKRATVLRRISRRMQVNGAEDLDAYLTYLRRHPGETGALLQDLLISVTNFFRDAESFRALEHFIPELFKGKGAGDQVRVWVPACATGEEAYSMAMILSEYASKLEDPPQLQIFATDLDKMALEVAREGRYPETITADVSEERLRRFFTKETGSYRMKRGLREIVLFALHDLLKDSPFSRLDLVCCRNLLIYLNREAQGKVFDIFHFSLRPGGLLFLGSSESAEEATSVFSCMDKKHRIYSRRALHRVGLSVPTGSSTLAFNRQIQEDKTPVLPPAAPISPGLMPTASVRQDGVPRNVWSDLHFKLIERLAPPSLIVSPDHEILHLSRSAGRYLQLIGGEPTMNVLRIIHPTLRTQLRAALFRATKFKPPFRTRGIPVELDGSPRIVAISVEAVEDLDFLLVMFHETDPSEAIPELSESAGPQAPPSVVQHLEDELDEMRVRLRDNVEQYEASTEELKASNEELQAMNEELRSATEELETGREELQSINEEIITINHELKSKVEELSRANSDLQNLMASTNIATIFLDREFQIKRFTPSTTGLFNFIPADIGRPLSDLTTRLEYPGMLDDAKRVLECLSLVEREVRDIDGRWFLARMLPYRTPDEEVAGVVITCVDITARKEAEETSRWLSAIVESSNDAIMSFAMDGTIVSWNHGAERVFGYTAEEIQGRSRNILIPPERLAEKQELVESLKLGLPTDQMETVCVRKDGTRIHTSLSASVMRNETGEIVGATAILQDITVRKNAVEELKQARAELEARVEQRTTELRKRAEQLALMASDLTITEQRERKRMAHVLHDQLQQLLVAAKMRVESFHFSEEDSRRNELTKLVELLDEALANSRSLAVELSPPILAEGLGRALEWLCCSWMNDKHQLKVHFQSDPAADTQHEDMRILVFLAVKELLFNIVKHSGTNEAFVDLEVQNQENLRVSVKDHGVGFDIENTASEDGRGSGFGLLSLRERLEMLGGTLEIHSSPDDGVEAIITAPRARTDF